VALCAKELLEKDKRKKEIQVDLNKIKTHKLVWLANSIHQINLDVVLEMTLYEEQIILQKELNNTNKESKKIIPK
jgi:hypothetical protein